MAWKKGTSGNPNGNPGKDKLLRTALLMELKSKGEDMPELRQIARKCIDVALEGQSWAVKEIWDRLDGKPAQSVTTDVKEKRSVLDWTDEELIEFLNESTGRGDGAAQGEGESDRIVQSRT
jgi:hypothetical protein